MSDVDLQKILNLDTPYYLPTQTPRLLLTTGATAVTRPPAEACRRSFPSAERIKVKGRRLDTTISLDPVTDILFLSIQSCLIWK